MDGLIETREDRVTAAMRRAVALSSAGGEATHPNPNVGAVVLDASGVIVGEGRHERAGGPHAEVLALAAAGDRARGGTAVVTLEPCAHTGRTGPCTGALLAAGVARVVYATASRPRPRPAAPPCCVLPVSRSSAACWPARPRQPTSGG